MLPVLLLWIMLYRHSHTSLDEDICFFFLVDRDLGVGPAAAGVRLPRTAVGSQEPFPTFPTGSFVALREALPPLVLEPWQVGLSLLNCRTLSSASTCWSLAR